MQSQDAPFHATFLHTETREAAVALAVDYDAMTIDRSSGLIFVGQMREITRLVLTLIRNSRFTSWRRI